MNRKYTVRLLILAIVLFGMYINPKKASAAANVNIGLKFYLIGTSADNGGLQLSSVPNISFPTSKMGSSQSISAVAKGDISVTDFRGGSDGYTVLAKATPFVNSNNPNAVLDVSSFQVSVADSVAVSTVSNSVVKGMGLVEIYQVTNKICYGQSSTNGYSSSGAMTAKITLNGGNMPNKAGQYTGEIIYTLQDAL